MRSVIAFDMDGVLVDSRSSIIQSLNATLVRWGFPEVNSDQSSLIGLPLREMIRTASKDRMVEEQVNIAVSIYRQLNDELGPKTTTIFPDMSLVLSKLALKYDLIVVTSKLQSSACKLLRSLNLNKFFVEIFGPETDDSIEKKSETLGRAEKFCQERTAHYSKIIALVGDRASDISAARLAGISAVAAKWGYGSQHELETADFVADSPKELLEFFA